MFYRTLYRQPDNADATSRRSGSLGGGRGTAMGTAARAHAARLWGVARRTVHAELHFRLPPTQCHWPTAPAFKQSPTFASP